MVVGDKQQFTVLLLVTFAGLMNIRFVIQSNLDYPDSSGPR